MRRRKKHPAICDLYVHMLESALGLAGCVSLVACSYEDLAAGRERRERRAGR